MLSDKSKSIKDEICNGVITKLKENSITIACEDVIIDELESIYNNNNNNVIYNVYNNINR